MPRNRKNRGFTSQQCNREVRDIPYSFRNQTSHPTQVSKSRSSSPEIKAPSSNSSNSYAQGSETETPSTPCSSRVPTRWRISPIDQALSRSIEKTIKEGKDKKDRIIQHVKEKFPDRLDKFLELNKVLFSDYQYLRSETSQAGNDHTIKTTSSTGVNLHHQGSPLQPPNSSSLVQNPDGTIPSGTTPQLSPSTSDIEGALAEMSPLSFPIVEEEEEIKILYSNTEPHINISISERDDQEFTPDSECLSDELVERLRKTLSCQTPNIPKALDLLDHLETAQLASKLSEVKPHKDTDSSTFPIAKEPSHPFSVIKVKETLNKSLHQLREIIHFKDHNTTAQSLPGSKAEELFSSIEAQFDNLLLLVGIHKDGHDPSQANLLQSTSQQAFIPQEDEVNPPLVPSPQKTMAENTRRHTLLLYPAIETSQDLPTLLNETLPASEFKIKGLQSISKNGIAVSFNTEEDKSSFNNIIQLNESIASKILTKQPGVRHPSIIIKNVPTSIQLEEIQSTIQSYSKDSGLLKARFQFPGSKPDTTNWVLESPATVLKELTLIKKIPLRWKMYQISEFFHIKRCNFCQAYGHTTKNCHHNIPSCATCAGYHPTKDCLSDYCFCVNCYSKNLDHNIPSLFHSARDKRCPCYLAEIEMYKNSRDYSHY
ncbi:hypothetical protein AVEN_273396-1 [Araneus ventricosus]|uniref:Thyroglobulin type-1 domain-containing protein n=1 Tax=Araneus ventricosus TaxID=182803 RepID=A0A4Y2R9R8_ARAVE|nr:hypothetical protein AVEN_273396-1 [Araneus ventricosus]